MLLTSFVVLKMMVAIVLQAFQHLLDAKNGRLQPWLGEAYQHAWATHDPDATGRTGLRYLH